MQQFLTQKGHRRSTAVLAGASIETEFLFSTPGNNSDRRLASSSAPCRNDVSGFKTGIFVAVVLASSKFNVNDGSVFLPDDSEDNTTFSDKTLTASVTTTRSFVPINTGDDGTDLSNE